MFFSNPQTFGWWTILPTLARAVRMKSRSNTSRTAVFQEAYACAFDAASHVLIMPPPPAKAGETPFSGEALAGELAARGVHARCVSGNAEVLELLQNMVKGRTLIVTLSNGSMDGLPFAISSGFRV